MTSAEELELTHAALRAYVAELRARTRETSGGSLGLVSRQIADEIESRFLTDDAWQRITAEPVAAFGEREEELERVKTELFGPLCHDGYRRRPRERVE